MPIINISIGNRNLALVYEEGTAGFIEIQDTKSDMSLHIRVEDEQLIALHFVEGEVDPANQIDLDIGDLVA
jgi:hypothetical protein